MNRIVGGGPASRLFINLREEKGYTYGAYSFFSAQKYPGPWSAGGDVRTEATEGAMTEFFNEMRRVCAVNHANARIDVAGRIAE